MARNSRIPDKHSAGRSTIVPFKREEDPMRRHTRRLDTNLCYQPHVREWCGKNAYTLLITNDGHHWQFKKGDFLAEWWPSSAKLVINKQWHSGIHCHDYQTGSADYREGMGFVSSARKSQTDARAIRLDDPRITRRGRSTVSRPPA
jgi:hypothetical protein